MRTRLLIAVLLLLAVGPVLAGEVSIVVTPANGELPALVVPGQTAPDQTAPGQTAPGQTAPALTAARTAKTNNIYYKLWLPYFVVDTTSPSGVNTLFAVRNRSASAVSVTYRYYDPSYSYADAVIVHEILQSRQTRTVSIREVPGIPTDPATGLKTGVVEIEEDSMSGYLSGDWFLIDPANNFASGDRLVSFDVFCYAWDSRYFHGGPFSGGTTFTFFLGSNLTNGTAPIIVGQVFDEPGNLLGTIQLYTPDQAFEVNTAELPAHILAASGTIEWTIQNPYNGYVHTTFRALGRYSAGLPAMCVDNALGLP